MIKVLIPFKRDIKFLKKNSNQRSMFVCFFLFFYGKKIECFQTRTLRNKFIIDKYDLLVLFFSSCFKESERVERRE